MRYHVENMPTRSAHDGDEMDAFSRKARRALHWRAGEVRAIKTRSSRRNRRATRKVLREERY